MIYRRLIVDLVSIVLASANAASTIKPQASPDALSQPEIEAVITAFNAGKYDDTIDLVQSYGQRTTMDAEAQFYFGYALLRTERLDESLVAIETALRLRPNDLRAIYLRGVLRFRLGLPEATHDLELVAGALPDAPIGQSSAEYLAEIARTQPATQDVPDVGNASTASPAIASNASDSAPETQPTQQDSTAVMANGEQPRTHSFDIHSALRLAFEYDTNPSVLPNSNESSGAFGPGGGATQVLGRASAAPAMSVTGHVSVTHDLSQQVSLVGAVSAFQRMYLPQSSTASTTSPTAPAINASNQPVQAGGPSDPAVSSTTSSGTSQSNSSFANDSSELALDLATDWRSGALKGGFGYSGALSLYEFTPFAHEHSLALRLAWPYEEAVLGTVRASGYTIQPFHSEYNYLRGVGATLRSAVGTLFMKNALLIEAGIVAEVFDAADYRDEALGRFFSYSFVGYGPELYVSYLGPYGTHFAVWGGLKCKRFLDADVDPYANGGQPLWRRDLRWSAGARAAIDLTPQFELFTTADYLDNRSNLDAQQHDNQNARRLLLSAGVTWQ